MRYVQGCVFSAGKMPKKKKKSELLEQRDLSVLGGLIVFKARKPLLE